MKIQKVHCALSLAALIAQPTLALDSKNQSTTETMLVTATRTQQTMDETLASVSVLNSEQIRLLQPQNLFDLLSHLPGVDMSRNGSHGSKTSLYLRGTNDGQTLILVDGVRISSATLGTTSIQYLDPEQIERIEVVRGPRSSLYGSEAIGGVIQIFTKRGEGKASPLIKQSYGSDNSRETLLGLSGRRGSTQYNFSVNHSSTDGIDSHIYDGNTDADEDAYRNTTVTGSLDHSWENSVKAGIHFYQSKGENEYDAGPFGAPGSQPYGDFKIESLSGNLSVPVMQGWDSSLTLGYSKDKSDDRDENLASSFFFHTKRYSATWQNDLEIGEDQLLTLGVDYYDDQVSSSSSYAVDNRDNKAYFAQYQSSPAQRIDLVAGVRVDDNEQFGSQNTYHVALGLDLTDRHRLIISHGTGFKAPSFNDLYWPVTPWSAGNPDLDPEESSNIEVELRGDYSWGNWSLSLYENRIDDLINWAETSPFFWQPSNVDDAKIKGVEALFQTRVAGAAVVATASWIDPRDRDTDNLLARRAQRSFTLDIDKEFDSLALGGTLRAQSARYDDVANSKRLGGYGVVNLRATYAINAQFKAQLMLNNVLDQDYQLAADYHTQGTQAVVSLSYQL